MNIFVRLIDVFDIAVPSILEQKLEYSFGNDGKYFWENFFLCENKCIKNAVVVYLFTEYQLHYFGNWLRKKYESCNEEIIKNLNYSHMNLFMTINKTNINNFSSRIHTYYVKKNQNFIYGLKQVFFNLSPFENARKNYIDFFSQKFNYEPPSFNSEKERNDELQKITAIRSEIEKIFDGPKKNDIKWLHYLGPKYADIHAIDYCISKCDCCSFMHSIKNNYNIY